MRRNQDVPSTISDKDWAKIQGRARKANPRRDDLCDPKAIRSRKQSSEQLKKARWS